MNLPSLLSARKLVVKIGSALLVDAERAEPRLEWLASVAADIAALRARGVAVIVVSSGAIALARRQLNLMHKKLRLDEKQAAAAVGQIRLAQAWSEALSAHRLTAAQLLLTLEDSEDRRRYLNARETLNTLLSLGATATTTAWPPASPKWSTPTSWSCCPTSTASTPPTQSAMQPPSICR